MLSRAPTIAVLSGLFLFVVGLLVGACSRIKDEDPIERAPQACCLSSDFQLKHFKGCRISGGECKTRKGERFWMRGYVTCGPVDVANCEGGRCCTYKPQYAPDLNPPVENWKPPGFEKPTNNVTPEQGAPPEPSDAPKPETPAAPPTDDTAPPADDPEAPLPPK